MDLLVESVQNRLNELVADMAREIEDIIKSLPPLNDCSYELKNKLFEDMTEHLKETLLYGVVLTASNGVVVSEKTGLRLAEYSEFLTPEQKESIEQDPDSEKAVHAQVRKELEAKIRAPL